MEVSVRDAKIKFVRLSERMEEARRDPVLSAFGGYLADRLEGESMDEQSFLTAGLSAITELERNETSSGRPIRHLAGGKEPQVYRSLRQYLPAMAAVLSEDFGTAVNKLFSANYRPTPATRLTGQGC